MCAACLIRFFKYGLHTERSEAMDIRLIHNKQQGEHNLSNINSHQSQEVHDKTNNVLFINFILLNILILNSLIPLIMTSGVSHMW